MRPERWISCGRQAVAFPPCREVPSSPSSGWCHLASTVVVLGAGATLSLAAELRPRHNKEHPPLDATFFSTTNCLAERSPPVAQQVRRLEKAIAGSPDFESPFTSHAGRLETFFADVYYEVSATKSDAAMPVFSRSCFVSTIASSARPPIGCLHTGISLGLTDCFGLSSKEDALSHSSRSTRISWQRT